MSEKMVAEAEVICQKTMAMPVLDMKYRVCVSKEHNLQIDVASPPSSAPSFGEVCVSETISTEISRFESVCSLAFLRVCMKNYGIACCFLLLAFLNWDLFYGFVFLGCYSQD